MISIMIRCGIMWISGAAQGELRPDLHFCDREFGSRAGDAQVACLRDHPFWQVAH